MSAALDNLVDRLERQVVRARERPRSVRDRAEELQSRGTTIEESMPPAEAPARPEVVEIKRYDMTPMFEEDAIVRMDELGHAFFVFLNAETDRIGVVYRRGDGGYGMIDPVVERSGRAS